VVDDPYAHHFLSPPLRALLKGTGLVPDKAWNLSIGLRAFVIARHRFIDDALERALDDGIDQLLVLGAGYDTRAWRFANQLGRTPVFEVDHPATGARKARIAATKLPEQPYLVRVPIDFQTQDLAERLRAEGFVANQRTFVIWEGVTIYLMREAVVSTLSALAGLCGPGSTLALDGLAFPDRPDWLSTWRRTSPQLLGLLGEPITFVLHPDDLPAFASRQGWQVRDIAPMNELGRRYLPGSDLDAPMYIALLARSSARV